MAKRFERFKLDAKVEKTPQGYLRVPAFATKVGVRKFRLPDGTVRRELRPPDEVFHSESMLSLAHCPLTNEHPREGIVTPENVRDYSVGHVGEKIGQSDGKYLECFVTIQDSQAIKDVEDGVREEVSCGYTCEHDETPGVWNGEEYDLVQRNIRYNHLALTRKSRLGEDVRLKLDSEDAEILDEEVKPKEKENTKMKVMIDGKEFEVSDEVGAAVQSMQKQMDSMKAQAEGSEKTAQDNLASMNSLKEEKEKAEAKADSLASEVEKLKVEVKAKTDSQVDVKALVKARKQLEVVADSMGVENYEDMEDQDLKKAVIKADSSEANLEGKSDVYINARFDMVAEKMDGAEKKATDLGKELNKEAKPEVDSASARERAMERAKKLSQEPLAVENKVQ